MGSAPPTADVPDKSPQTDHEKLVAAALNPDPKFIALREDIEKLVLEAFPKMTPAQQNAIWKDEMWREKIRGRYAEYGSETQRDIDALILAGHFRGEESWESFAVQKIGRAIDGVRSMFRKIFGRPGDE